MTLNTSSSPILDTDIHLRLDQLLTTDLEQYNSSLFNGLSGLACYYITRMTTGDVSSKPRAERVLGVILERLNNCNFKLTNLYSLCNGLTGIAFTLHYAVEQKLLDNAILHQIAPLEELMVDRAMKAFEERNTDFLHGPMGVLLYLSRRSVHSSRREWQQALVEKLIAYGKWDERGFRTFNSVIDDQATEEYNMSLAHGLCGQLLVLNEVYHSGSTDVLPLIKSGLKYFLSLKQKQAPFFPGFFIEKDKNGKERANYTKRVAWCYGDLNAAFLFLKSDNAYQDTDLYQEGIEIALNTTRRQSPETAVIKDAFVCHGTMGAAYLYHRLYTKTARTEFITARDHWLRQHKLFITYSLATLSNPTQELSLLEGTLGVALLDLIIKHKLTSPIDEVLLLH